MNALQVAFFFTISYFLSRVFVVLKIPELIIYYLFEKKHVSIQKLTFILIISAALISSFIGHIITVLALMPLVLLLQKEFDTICTQERKINTLFLLSVVWGANIGGIGMVTGTGTNGILMGFYELYKIPFGRDFTFLTWMSWGIPLLILLSIIGWVILMAVFQPGKLVHAHDFSSKLESFTISRKLQKVGFALALLFIISSALLSLGMSLFHHKELMVIAVTVVWMLVFMYFMLVFRWKTENNHKQPLLKFKDSWHDFPKRGLLWVAIGVTVSAIFWYLSLHKQVGLVLQDLFNEPINKHVFYLLLALTATFASEIFSNTGVHVTMFMVLFPLTKHNPNLTWEGMLVITLCSTCAFMSPIGTPANGLGFGSSKKISIRHLVSAGFLMNIASALIISLWVTLIVPLIHG
jgi:sodium-dependent dicarboxylate transporter 2/3/5